VRSQLAGHGPVREYLRPEAVEAVLADARRFRCEQFSVVLTVTSIIDSLAAQGPSVLEAFRYTPMT
jgi:hypothetical protein